VSERLGLPIPLAEGLQQLGALYEMQGHPRLADGAIAARSRCYATRASPTGSARRQRYRRAREENAARLSRELPDRAADRLTLM